MMVIMMTFTNHEELIRVKHRRRRHVPGTSSRSSGSQLLGRIGPGSASPWQPRSASGFPRCFRTFAVLIRQHWSTVMTHDCAENNDLLNWNHWWLAIIDRRNKKENKNKDLRIHCHSAPKIRNVRIQKCHSGLVMFGGTLFAEHTMTGWQIQRAHGWYAHGAPPSIADLWTGPWIFTATHRYPVPYITQSSSYQQLRFTIN